ncbi:TRAP transporter small permease [Lacisediminimonas sp.]|uniref:TRAP transporter small permease n=1 Tax=Lacisediminimonas sp. TaxID=3060582 RepID=UPI0027244038|nr:TRAP transporter small permease [Lacisediminimonas sp.]MDO8300300.1 TRAP transporter small permease [Lacisediminimonas sp.]
MEQTKGELTTTARTRAMHETAMPAQDEQAIQRGAAGALLFQLARALALAGGMLLIAIVLMSLVSILARKLIAMPVPGDIEMLQMGMAIAAAAMLPYCEMTGGHLRVDFFTANLPPRLRGLLDAVSHLLLALVAALIAWRTGVAAGALRTSGETSMMLAWPVWVAWAALVPSFLLFSAAGLYNAAREFKRARRQ